MRKSGILQTARRIITATVKRSIMLSTSQNEAPCFCSSDKRIFSSFLKCMINEERLKEPGTFSVSTGK